MYLVTVNHTSLSSSDGLNGADPMLLTENLEHAISVANHIIEDILTEPTAVIDSESDGKITVDNLSVIIFWDKQENWLDYQEVVVKEMEVDKNYYCERNGV